MNTNLSLAKLVKLSAKKNLYDLTHDVKISEDIMILLKKGEEKQKEFAKKYDAVQEIGGSVTIGQFTLYFYIDAYKPHQWYAEHKSMAEVPKRIFIHKSIAQVACYISLFKQLKTLKHSKFYLEENEKEQQTYKIEKIPFYLVFNDFAFSVEVNSHKAVRKAVISKINALENWEKANAFDNEKFIKTILDQVTLKPLSP